MESFHGRCHTSIVGTSLFLALPLHLGSTLIAATILKYADAQPFGTPRILRSKSIENLGQTKLWPLQNECISARSAAGRGFDVRHLQRARF
jgi:hypothetical protein